MIIEPSENVLLVRAGARICALPLAHVAETMRRLPVARLVGMPAFVEGAAVVRGETVPVIDLGALLGGAATRVAPRFVLIRAGARRAVISVDEVVGLAPLPPAHGVPLLSGAAGGAVEALGARDRRVLAVLDASRLVPEDVWQAAGAASRGTP